MKACWFYQKAASWMLDSTAPAPSWIQRHLADCPDCAHFHREQDQLISTLRATASAQLADPPPFLRGKILSTLRAEARRPVPQFHALRWVRAMIIPALGVVLFMAYVVRKPDNTSSLPSSGSPPIRSFTEAVEKIIPKADASQLLSWTEQVDQPLETELDSVMTDAKSAVQGFAMNFLPDQMH